MLGLGFVGVVDGVVPSNAFALRVGCVGREARLGWWLRVLIVPYLGRYTLKFV